MRFDLHQYTIRGMTRHITHTSGDIPRFSLEIVTRHDFRGKLLYPHSRKTHAKLTQNSHAHSHARECVVLLGSLINALCLSLRRSYYGESDVPALFFF